MGKVEINMEVVNNEEVIKSKFLPDTVTRSVSISTLLVDNSATTLWLPKKVIEQLGLPMAKEVVDVYKRQILYSERYYRCNWLVFIYKLAGRWYHYLYHSIQ